MRALASLAVLACAALGATPVLAAASAPATTEIVQQRLSDGSVLFTDQPVPGAATERKWQLPAEDPVAARRRARDVSAEAEAVSERIQRLLAQQRRAADESERLRLARADLERQRERDRAAFEADRVSSEGVVFFVPQRLHAARRFRAHDEHRFGHADRSRGMPLRAHRSIDDEPR